MLTNMTMTNDLSVFEHICQILFVVIGLGLAGLVTIIALGLIGSCFQVLYYERNPKGDIIDPTHSVLVPDMPIVVAKLGVSLVLTAVVSLAAYGGYIYFR